MGYIPIKHSEHLEGPGGNLLDFPLHQNKPFKPLEQIVAKMSEKLQLSILHHLP